MIAIDTNILIRFLIEDDVYQTKRAEKVLKEHNDEGKIYLSNIVLVETEWVLSSVYQFSKNKICSTIDRILNTKQFVFDDREVLIRANIKYIQKNKDFSDSLIGELGNVKSIKTYTFDKQLKNHPNFIVV